jgi:hypothetical protein
MALGVNIVSSFDSKGINKAISDFKKLDGAGSKATFGLRTLDKAATNGFKNVAKYGGLAAAGIGALALNFVKGAEFAKQADDRLAAVNKTMGLFGAQTAAVTKRLIEIGDKGEYQFGILAESIKDVQSKLLTFKEIAQEADVTGGLFDRATIAAIDLQAAGFGEATQNAVQLGKALNDPVKGITALARSGVTFTEQEKEKIKALVESGKMYEAQELLLKAIETQVGGTAAATTTATFKIGAAFGHVRDELGTLLLPLFEKFANFMVEKVVPYATKLAQVIGEDGIGAGMKMLAGTFLTATTNMGAFGNTILALTAAFVTLRLVSIAATIAQNLFNVALFSNPIGIVVAAVIAFVVILAALYLKFEIVRKAVNMFGEVLKFVFINTVTAVQNYFIGFINIAIMGINVLIKAANFFGAGLDEVGLIGFKAFTGIGSAAKSAKAQISGVAETAGAFAAKEGGVREIAKALKAVGSAAGGEGGAGGGGAAKAVETAGEKLQKYIDKLKGLTQAQRSYRDSQKGVLKADTDLLEAKTKLADAQAYMNQVLKGYGAGSKQAKDRQKELDKAQRGVERSNYDVEGAVFGVRDAEAELAKLRADPESSAQAIREAEISLAEAKLSVVDATDSQTDATTELATAQLLLDEAINGASKSSNTYLEAAKALMDAQIAERDATDQQTAAYERQKDALDALTKAQEEATTAKTGVKPSDASAAEADANAPVVVGGGETVTSAPVSTGNPISDILDRFTGDARRLMAERLGAGGHRFSAFADGGIVTSPMMGLVGEAGSEAIIPLDRLSEFGGQTINVTINAGIGTDASAVGDEIVNVLQRYNRRNGALPLKVA